MITVGVIDLGDSQATALVATVDAADKLKIAAVGTAPVAGVRRGLIADLDEAAKSIAQAVSVAESSFGKPMSPWYIGIRGSHLESQRGQGIKLIVPKGRTITHQDVLEVVNHSRAVMLAADREVIQVVPRAFRVDGEGGIRQPVGMSGGKLEADTTIVTGQTASLQNVERVMQQANLELGLGVLSALGSALGSLSQEEIEHGSVCIDMGSGTTDIALFLDGSLAFSACLPVGSGHVTNDIAALIKTSPEEAERLKLQFGSAHSRSVPENESVEVLQLGQPVARPMQRRVLAEIIESRIREIAQLTRQQLDRSGAYKLVTHGAVLTGNGVRLPGCEPVFSEVLGMRVRSVVPDRGTSAAIGLARYAAQCVREDGGAPTESWRDRVKSIFTSIGR